MQVQYSMKKSLVENILGTKTKFVSAVGSSRMDEQLSNGFWRIQSFVVLQEHRKFNKEVSFRILILTHQTGF